MRVLEARRESAPVWLAAVFFASGFAALLYQTVWQRVLFSTVGTNIESVTLIVTAFLLGLGSLAGAHSPDCRSATCFPPLPAWPPDTAEVAR